MATDREIYQERIDRSRALMESTGIDTLIIGPSSDFGYFTGHIPRASERLTALVINLHGPASIVVPRLEVSNINHLSDDFQLHAWEETESPIDHLIELIRRSGSESVGFNDQIWGGFILALQEQLPERNYSRGARILSQLRSVKDPSEIEILREASRRTDVAWEHFCANSSLIGRTESEIASELTQTMLAHGLDHVAFCIVASGPNGASPHHHTADRVIEQGDPIVIDFGGTYQGYFSDVTRTPVAGEADKEFQKAYAVVLEAQQAAFEKIGPGVPCQDIDRVARKIINDAGYGEYFIHRLGHGIGMTGHEDPYLVEGNEELLQPRMVVSDEPGIYIPGKWGIRVEDTVAVTETGGERYNHVSRDILNLR